MKSNSMKYAKTWTELRGKKKQERENILLS